LPLFGPSFLLWFWLSFCSRTHTHLTQPHAHAHERAHTRAYIFHAHSAPNQCQCVPVPAPSSIHPHVVCCVPYIHSRFLISPLWTPVLFCSVLFLLLSVVIYHIMPFVIIYPSTHPHTYIPARFISIILLLIYRIYAPDDILTRTNDRITPTYIQSLMYRSSRHHIHIHFSVHSPRVSSQYPSHLILVISHPCDPLYHFPSPRLTYAHAPLLFIHSLSIPFMY
jgi:hypothetical protein